MTEDYNATPTEFRLPVLKVIGLGGGGSNAVNRMIELGLKGVDFIAANTDLQALEACLAPVKVQLGPKLTRGLGAGGNPEIGYKAAQESRAELGAALAGADMVFLTAGMGGGTGTGAIAVAGEIARAQGAVTIAVVTTPFSFEMGRRQTSATFGLQKLRPHTDTLISIPNDRLLYVAPQDLPLETSFRLADDVLRQAVQGIAELVTEPGLINVDFAHIRHVMKIGGGALMAIGQAEGEGKAMNALHQALHHPLLESVSLKDAAGVIANFSGGKGLSLYEVGEVLDQMQQMTNDDVDVIMGVTHNERLGDRAQLILVITGLGAPTLEEAMSPEVQAVSQDYEAAKQTPEPVFAAVERSEPSDQAPTQPTRSKKPAPIPVTSLPDTFPIVNQDIDLPAFMRRRARYTDGASPQPAFGAMEQ